MTVNTTVEVNIMFKELVPLHKKHKDGHITHLELKKPQSWETIALTSIFE